MNIAEAFANYMQDRAIGVFGTDIFIGAVPQDAPANAWWLVSAGGSPEQTNDTGEMLKNYIVSVYYRSLDASGVYNQMQELEELVNADDCTQLDGFDTIAMTATAFPADQDIDSEERTIGLVQITIRVYSE
jgi:hypothetical protein